MIAAMCPECGARVPAEGRCRDRFDLCIALEFENPDAFGAVHHLSVLSYMLQHNVYSRAVWFEARDMLAGFLRDGVTPEEMRRRNRTRFDSAQRAWRVTRGSRFAEFDSIVWSRTIADIRLEDPAVYCADVKAWAASILEDTEGSLNEFGK